MGLPEHMLGSSQTPVTPASKNIIPSSDLSLGICSQMLILSHKHIHIIKTESEYVKLIIPD